MIDFLLMFGIASFYLCFVVLFTKAWIFCIKLIQEKSVLDSISLLFITFIPTFILFMCSFWYWVVITEHTKFMF